MSLFLPTTTRGGEWRPPVPPAGTTRFTSPGCIGGTNSQISDKLRAEILLFYADSIDIILRSGDYLSQELRQLEKAALAMAYFGRGFALPSRETDVSFPFPCPGGTLDQYLALDILDSCLAPVRRGPNFVSSNVGGRIGLVRLLAYEIRSAAPAAVRANAIVDLVVALHRCRFRGHEARRRPADRATSKDATRAEQRDLIRLIESSTFRPRFVDGKPADSAPVVARYHLGP